MLLTTKRPTAAAITWVKSHRARVRPGAYGRAGGTLPLYDCRRAERPGKRSKRSRRLGTISYQKGRGGRIASTVCP